ncbi:MAG: PQQ-binding-like beta-propeller repeat protein [Bryobacteraceae bacterium]
MWTNSSARCATWINAAMLVLCAVPLNAELSGKMAGCVLAGGTNRVVILDSRGEIVWEHPAALVHDVWMLPGGNILFADGQSVTEVTPGHKVVFRFQSSEQRGGGTYACQRLENGDTVIGENSTGKILEVDQKGRVVFQLQTTPATAGAHHNMRMVRKVGNGNYLVCHSGTNLVNEYAPDGTVVWEMKTPALPFAAIRTAGGTTLVSELDHICEYDSSGKIVWQFANTDLPGVVITKMTGMHLLPDGNIAVGCYAAYNGKEGNGLFEITRDRKLVWRYANPAGDRSMMAVQRLDDRGNLLPGRCLR